MSDFALKVRHVVKRFGTRTVLDDISFNVKKGEIVFVLGTSGTGKSVLLKNIVGLMTPESGEIWVDGENVSGYKEEQFFKIRQKCGMVFQHPALFDSLTIFENICFGLRRHYQLPESELLQRVQRSLALVQLKDIEHKLPSEISYGMQKRVSLARTVALEPKILLFDEPTTGLDPITTSAVNRLIKELSRKINSTSVVVSHDMMCALEIADRIIVLDHGRIVADATTDTVFESEHPLIKDFMSEVDLAEVERRRRAN